MTWASGPVPHLAAERPSESVVFVKPGAADLVLSWFLKLQVQLSRREHKSFEKEMRKTLVIWKAGHSRWVLQKVVCILERLTMFGETDVSDLVCGACVLGTGMREELCICVFEEKWGKIRAAERKW